MTNFLNQPWLFLPLFVVFWCAICLLLSRISGWASLATYYASSKKPEGGKFLAQSISLGFTKFFAVSYGNCITANLYDDTLYMKVMPIFGLGHSKLSIPLTDIEAELSHFLFFKTVKVRFKKVDRIKMRVFRGFGDKLLRMKDQPTSSQPL